MKSIKQLSALAAISCLALSIQAEEPINHYPVAYNGCDQVVNVANIGDGALPKYYMSRDCKTLYLMPPSEGTIEAEISLTEGNLNRYCEVMKIDDEIYKLKNKRLRIIEEKLLNNEESNTLSEAQVVRLEATSARLREEMKTLVDKFSRVEAGRAYLKLEAGITDKYYSDFVLANQHLVHQGVNIVEMDIDKGFLSVPKLVETVAPAILSLSVSGQLATVQHENKFSQTYMMHSRAGAQIIFGLGRGCAMHWKIQEAEANNQLVDEDKMGRMFVADIAPNYFYIASVSSIASYKAVLKSLDFVKLFYEKFERKSKFSHKNIEDVILEADLITVSDIVFDGGRALSPEDEAMFRQAIHTDVRNRFTSILIEKLKNLNLVDDIDPDTDLEAPSNGTERRYVGSVRRCSRKKFLGVTYSKKCRDVPIYKIVDVAGVLDNEFMLDVSTTINLEENLTQNGFYDVAGSANFNYKGGERD